MADELNVLKVGMDISDMRGKGDALASILDNIAGKFERLSVIAKTVNEKNETVSVSLRSVAKDGEVLNTVIKQTEEGLTREKAAIELTSKAYKELKDKQDATTTSAETLAKVQKRSAELAADFMKTITQPGPNTSQAIVQSFRRAQEGLRAAFAETFNKGIPPDVIFKLIEDVHKKRISPQMSAPLIQLQAALQGVFGYEEKITKEKEKQKRLDDAKAKTGFAERALITTKDFITKQGLGTQSTDTPAMLAAFRAAQMSIAQGVLQAYREVGATALTAAASPYTKIAELRNNIITAEVGGAAKVQAGVLKLLDIEKDRVRQAELLAKAAERKKIADEKIAQVPIASTFRLDVQRQLGAIPAGTTSGQLTAYQQQLVRLQTAAEKSKLDAVELDTFFKLASKSPTFDFSQGIKEWANLQSAITKTISAFQNLGSASSKTRAELTHDQSILARVFRQDVQAALPIPGGASLAQIASFQQQLNSLQRTAARTPLPTGTTFSEFFQRVRAEPGADLSGGNLALSNLQAAINRTLAAYQQLGKAGTEAGDRIGLSFSRLATILQIQVIHRVFGGFITEIQQSVAAAANLQVKIAEIQTVAQRANVTFETLQSTVRRLSEEFGRPQTDVAEAAYQAFSNQIIRTRADMSFLDEAMRFSRISVSSATDSVNLLSSVLNAYRIPVVEARRVSDSLFATIDLGRLRTSDIANTFGRVGVTANQLGITFEETAGSIALLTQRGISPSESMTQLSSVMQGLIRPSRELQQYFRQLGVTTGTEFIAASGGFVGAIRRIMQAVESGSVSIGELEHNIRAIRGVFGLSGESGAELANIIAQITNGADRANEAFRLMSANVGENFNREMIKIKNMFINDFGDALITEITRLAEPFGGISGLMKRVAEGIMTIIDVGIYFVRIITNMVNVFERFGLTIARMIEAFFIIRGAMYAFSFVMSLSTVATQQNTAAMNMNALSTTGAATQVALLTQVQERAIVAFSNFKTILAGVFIGFAIREALVLLDEYISVSGRAAASTRTLREQIRALEQAQRNRAQAEAVVASRENAIFREEIETQAAILLEANRAGMRGLEILRDRQRETWRQTTENLRVAGRGVTEEMQRIVSEIRNNITQAYSAIETSRRKLASFRDRDITEVFKQTLAAAQQTGRIERSNVSQSLAQSNLSQDQYEQIHENLQQIREDASAAQNAFELQNRLIRGRMNQLLQEARRLEQTGNREDMDSARRRYDEVRQLMTQQFNLQNENNRTQMQAHLRIRATETGIAQRGTVQIDVRAYEREQADLRNVEARGERGFQVLQTQTIANAQVMLNLERQREQRITDTQRRLQAFTVVDPEGRLLQRFRGPGGLELARQDFGKLAIEAQRALGPIALNADEIVRLTANVGTMQAAVIQEALRRNQLTAEQRNQLERSVTQERARQIALQLENHRINSVQILEFTRAINNSMLELDRTLNRERAVEAARARAEKINAAVAEANREREQARTNQAQAGDLAATQVTQGLTELARIRENVRRFTATFWSANAAADAMENITAATNRAMEALQRYDRIRAAPGSTAAQITAAAAAAERALRAAATVEREIVGEGQIPVAVRGRAAAIGEEINRSATAINAANVAMQRTTDILAALQREVAALPANTVAAAMTAIAAARNVANGLVPLEERIRGIGAAIRDTRDALLQFGIVAEQVAGRAPAPVGVPAAGAGAVGGFAAPLNRAAGGLIGNAFASRGPDDIFIAARRGEFVVNPEMTRRFYPQLVAINSGAFGGYAQGGLVTNTTTVGDITIKVDGSSSPEETARTVLSKIRREIRRGN